MKSDIPTLNDIWKLVEKSAIPDDAPDVQRREQKRMFFIGAQAIFEVLFMKHIAHLPDDEAEEAMKSIGKQFEGFCEAIKLGEA